MDFWEGLSLVLHMDFLSGLAMVLLSGLLLVLLSDFLAALLLESFLAELVGLVMGFPPGLLIQLSMDRSLVLFRDSLL